jgi:hypothetical protein
VAAPSAAARQNGPAISGFHAGTEPMCLRAPTVVRLKGTFRHSYSKLFSIKQEPAQPQSPERPRYDGCMALSDPPDVVRQRLTSLRNGLLKLHKTLLDSERARYERDIERIKSAGQLLNLVLHDPWFAWLHELSELIVLIDENLDADEPVTPSEATRLLAQTRTLLTPAESGNGFRRQYFEALQRDPDVVIAHGAAVQVLAGLG